MVILKKKRRPHGRPPFHSKGLCAGQARQSAKSETRASDSSGKGVPPRYASRASPKAPQVHPQRHIRVSSFPFSSLESIFLHQAVYTLPTGLCQGNPARAERVACSSFLLTRYSFSPAWLYGHKGAPFNVKFFKNRSRLLTKIGGLLLGRHIFDLLVNTRTDRIQHVLKGIESLLTHHSIPPSQCRSLSLSRSFLPGRPFSNDWESPDSVLT